VIAGTPDALAEKLGIQGFGNIRIPTGVCLSGALIRNENYRKDDEHSCDLFQQISDQPLGFMATGHPHGIRVQHVGSGPGIVTGSGFPRADCELSSRDMDWSGDARGGAVFQAALAMG